MPSQSDVSSQICAALAITQPDLDTSIGTTVRKISDAVSEVISEAYVDQYFQGYQYDITSLTGSSLDDFVNIFGFTRQTALRATGVVTFACPQPTPTPIIITAGTTVSYGSTMFVTLVTGILPVNGVSVDIPVIAQLGGSAGNVPANTITTFQSPLSGVSTVTNTAATSGGTDAESDSALITRFQNTVFRNMARHRGHVFRHCSE